MKKLIVIEGASDGIGKSTQFNLLKEYLEKKYKVTTHHFPTCDSYEGELVTKYLNGELGNKKDLSPYLINSIYAIDRALIWNNKLSKEDVDVILLDRYTTSSIIYQSANIENIEEKKEFIKYITDYEYNKLNIPKPDKVIFLNAPFELINDLRKKRNKEEKEDIHEKDIEFLEKVYENANYCAKYLNWDIIECSKNNKMKNIEEIHKAIIDTLGI